MTNNLPKNKWLTYTYKLPNNLLTSEQITNAVNDFNSTVLQNLSADQYLLIIFKIKASDKILRSISVAQRINKLTDLTELFKEYWNLKLDNYQQFLIQEIIFNYFLIDKENKITEIKITRPQPIVITPNFLPVGGSLKLWIYLIEVTYISYYMIRKP